MAEGPNGFTSGSTFLCPVAVLDFIDDLSEDELRTIRVEVPVDPHDN